MLLEKLLPLYEGEDENDQPDPNETPIQDRRLVTQPYDIGVSSLMEEIRTQRLYLRPLSDRPNFQRRYVWSDMLASRLIESILLNVPIPPCYLAQNDDYTLDVIDGQQRIYSIYRFANNQFKLSNLNAMTECNDKYCFQLPERLQRKFLTYTLRCVIITNDSAPEIRFDVFERLNSNTVPLNAQELRNCIYRGALIDLVDKLTEFKPWLSIFNRKDADQRMRDEELILRFFAFQILGLDSYKTPQKHWLNEMAKQGQKFSTTQINRLELLWTSTVEKCLLVFKPNECFRRLPIEKRAVINRALMDLTMSSLANVSEVKTKEIANEFYKRYMNVLQDDEFTDLITRAVDHKSRTTRRFEIWNEKVLAGLV